MATANEILAAETGLDNVWFEVDLLSRQIVIPKAVTNLGVKNDKDVMHVRFKLPRFFYDVDFSEFKIGIDYTNAEGEEDRYEPTDVTAGGSVITFTWVVGRHAALYEGTVTFGLCAKRLNPVDPNDPNNEFHTIKTSLPILDGMETCEQAIVMHTDLLEQWREQLFGEKDSLIANITEVAQAERKAIEDKGIEVLATIPADYQTAVSMTDNADRSKADAIICTAEGEIVTVTDSSDDYLRGLQIFGKTTQVTTTGKNLFDASKIVNNSRVTNNNGVVTVSTPEGSSAVDSMVNLGELAPGLEVGKSYIFTFDTTGTDKFIYLEEAKFMWGRGAAYIITQEMLDSDVLFYASGVSTTATLSNFMIRDASITDSTYEPYSGGFASPSLDWPQPLTSIENPTVNIYGKNLLKLVASTQTISGVTFTVNDDQSVTIKGTATAAVYYGLNYDVLTLIPGEQYTMTGGLAGSSGNTYRLYAQTIDGKKFYADYGNGVSFTATDEQWQVLFAVYKGTTVDFTIYPALRLKSVVDATYEPYVDQSNITLPYALNAVPIAEGGNYTDVNGQQWVCDEIDFERGVYIQRTKTITFDGTENWYISAAQYSSGTRFDVNISGVPPALSQDILCDRFVFKGANAGVETAWVLADNAGFRIITEVASTVDELTQFLADNPTTVIYTLKVPIETPLTAEEIQWFRFAHTNFPNTTVLNDAGATMQLKYNADTKTWIKNAQKPTDDQVQAAVDAWLTAHYASAEGAKF